MKLSHAFLPVIVFFGILSARAQTHPGISESEQEILAAFLSSASGYQSGTTNYIVMEMTNSDRVRAAAQQLREEANRMAFDAPLRQAVDNLVRKGAIELRVQMPTNRQTQITILSETERAALLVNVDPAHPFMPWQRFFEKFPGAKGITTISRIGIDNKKTTAILDITESANGGGGTRFYVLRRQGNIWRCTGEPILPMENRYSSIKKWLNPARQPTPVGSQWLCSASVSRRGCAECST